MTQANQAKAAQPELTAATQDIEWDVVDGGNTDFAVQYPRMQWVHGEKKASGFNKTGGLFIASEQYPNFAGEGSEPETFISRKDEIPGAAAASSLIAVIRIKHQWVKDEGRNVPLAHALIVVKGNDDVICLSLRGASKVMEFQKAFNQHMAHNVSLANRTRPQTASALEPFALWFPIAAGPLHTITSKDGKNESTVTLPSLQTPEKLDIDYVRSLWVGANNYKQFSAFWRETAPWQKVQIWEQRDAVADHAGEFSGGESDGLATTEQYHHFVNICTAKDFSEREIVHGITNGVTDDFMLLSREDARRTIDSIKNK